MSLSFAIFADLSRPIRSNQSLCFPVSPECAMHEGRDDSQGLAHVSGCTQQYACVEFASNIWDRSS